MDRSRRINEAPRDRAGPNFFPTPPWGTRALCEKIAPDLKGARVWEPACGSGYMARPLAEYAGEVLATDAFDYRAAWPGQHYMRDFLLRDQDPDPREAGIDWVITNPPFKQAEAFIETALEVARVGVAMLVRIQFLEGVTRKRRVFDRYWPAAVFVFAERLPIAEARVAQDISTNQAYIWIVWSKRAAGAALTHPDLRWFDPCRKRLERPGDYPAPPAPAPDPRAPSLFEAPRDGV